MLYKKNVDKKLSEELFRDPSKEYRGAPFWAWNTKVTKDLVERQIKCFKEMGFGGYHVHSRTGLDVKYLSREFMDRVLDCIESSKENDMLTWLYDEDRWPSGAAGGLVTKDPEFRARYLMLTKEERKGLTDDVLKAVSDGTDYFYAKYDISVNGKGEMTGYRRLEEGDVPEGDVWYAYVCPEPASGWFNNYTYVDAMNKKAIDRFIKVTHEKYKKEAGDEFGKTVPSIFSDEPQISKKMTFGFSGSGEDVRIPYTPGFDREYHKKYGKDFKDTIPELFWEKEGGEKSRARYMYHDLSCELFTKAFSDNIGKWCDENGIALTGHVMGEHSLCAQTEHIGEAMRTYRGFAIPGVDLLCDAYDEYCSLLQCASVVHQMGKEGMLSELYGVTGWDFDFRGHKMQGDWQACLGVTVRVPHLAWMSMKGDAKRDYPASIFYQSPWYKEYKYIEDHFARLNTALTRGTPLTDVAVIHPIESYWLNWGPSNNTWAERSEIEDNFKSLINWLLFSQINFDFVSESMLPDLYEETDEGFRIGKMTYKAVIVPPLTTIRSTTLKALKKFAEKGGTVIVTGNIPEYIDGIRSGRAEKMLSKCRRAAFTKKAITSELEDIRRVAVRDPRGIIKGDMIYCLRKDNDCRWLFVCRGRKGRSDHQNADDLMISVEGEYTPEVYDTLTGRIYLSDYYVKDGKTYIRKKFYTHDSLLLKLLPYDPKRKSAPCKEDTDYESYIIKENVNYMLSEENAMVLDMAEYKMAEKGVALGSGSSWHGKEELLRVNDICREYAGIPPYNGTQPWAEPPEKIDNYVDLRFTFGSDIEYEGAYLAIENAEKVTCVLNGKRADGKICGYFTDESISKIELPKIVKGKNVLEVRTPIGIRTKVEWCYLLGDFGVEVSGCEKKIVKLPEKIGFSSVTDMKMPFYTGNITYEEKIDLKEKCGIRVRVSEYKGALVKVSLDGGEEIPVVFDPYIADLGAADPGEHIIRCTLFGTRENAFGALHNTDVSERWKGPDLWYTKGSKWSYEYNIKDQGILAAPDVILYRI